MKIAIISNVTTDLLAGMLKKEHSVWQADGFGNWVQPCIDRESSLYRFVPDVIFTLFHGCALFPPEQSDANCWNTLNLIRQVYETLGKNFPNSMIFMGAIDIQQRRLQPVAVPRRERKLEAEYYDILCNLVTQNRNFCLFDLKEIVENLGRNAFYDAKMEILGGMPFALKALQEIHRCMQELLNAYQGKRKKVLALDLDNTLWGGVVGEDSAAGLKLAPDKQGKAFTEFQMRLQEMKSMGAILTIISKNNETDAENGLNDPRMVLTTSDFVTKSINWNAKPVNLANQAGMLNLGRDSFVFIDDNPVERESMKQALPEVIVPDFPADVSKLPAWASELYRKYFLTLRTTAEDQKKTQDYQAEMGRKDLAAQSLSPAAYLQALEIKVRISAARPEQYERIAQLTQKTNQFNLTTKRYTQGEIKAMAESNEWLVLQVSSSDRFGDNGLIAVAIVALKGAYAEVETLLMSCRVMGRTIENALIDVLEKTVGQKGAKRVFGFYYPTAKNAPVKDFWGKMGYAPDPDDNSKFCMELKKRRAITHYTTVESEL